METTQFLRAEAFEITSKIGTGKGKIQFACDFSKTQADKLGVPWLVFNKEAEVRGGFKEVKLDAKVDSCRVRFEPDGNLAGQVLNLEGDGVSDFVVQRYGDGKKKPKKTRIRFKVSHGGSMIPIFEYFERVGGCTGTLKIEPKEVQAKIDLTAEASGEPNWPKPDEDGDYGKGVRGPTMRPPKGAPGSAAGVRVLQIGPDRWLSTWYALSGVRGDEAAGSETIAEGTPVHLSRDMALLTALKAGLQGAESRVAQEGDSRSRRAQAWGLLAAWFKARIESIEPEPAAEVAEK